MFIDDVKAEGQRRKALEKQLGEAAYDAFVKRIEDLILASAQRGSLFLHFFGDEVFVWEYYSKEIREHFQGFKIDVDDTLIFRWEISE